MSAPKRLLANLKRIWSDQRHPARRVRAILATAGASGGVKAISMICSLVQVPIAIDLLGPEGFGLWMTLTSTIALMTFTDLGMGNGIQNLVTKYMAQDDQDGMCRAYSSGFAMLAVIGLGLLVLALPFLGIIPWAEVFRVREAALQSQVTASLAVVVLTFCIGLPLGAAQKVALGLQKGWLMSYTNLAASVGILGAVVLGAWLKADFLSFIVLAALPIPLANLILTIWLVVSHAWLRPKIRLVSKKEIRALALLGSQFFIPQLGASILFAAPQVIISNALGAAAVTPYNLCQRIFGIIQQIQTTSITPVWPAYAEAQERGDHRWVERTFIVTLIASAIFVGLMSALCVVAGPRLFALWVGENANLPTPDLVLWFAIWTTLVGLGTPAAYLLNGLSRLKGMLIYGSINLLVSLAAMLSLVGIYGVTGIVMALSISYAILVIPATFFDASRSLRTMKNFQPI